MDAVGTFSMIFLILILFVLSDAQLKAVLAMP
jgi:hypothetical protein